MCKGTSAIKCHAPRPGEILVLKPNSLDGLLAHDIPSRKEDLCETASAIELGASGAGTGIYSRSYGLCQERPLRKLQLVPVTRHAISAWALERGHGLYSERGAYHLSIVAIVAVDRKDDVNDLLLLSKRQVTRVSEQ